MQKYFDSDTMKKVCDYTVFLLLGTMFAWANTLCLLHTTILVFDPAQIFIFIFTLHIFMAFIFFNKYTTIGFFSLCLIVVLFIGLNLWLTDNFDDNVLEINVFIKGFIRYVTGYTNDKGLFTDVIVKAVSVAFTIISALCIYVTFNYSLIFITGATTFSICLMTGYMRETSIVYAFIFVMLVFTLKKLNLIGRQKTDRQYISNGRYTLAAAPLCFGAMLLASMIRTPEEKLNLTIVRDIANLPVEWVTDITYDIFWPKYFSFSSTGFDRGSGELGGNMKQSFEEVMEVYADESYYLSGAIKDVYTGRSWEKSKEDFTTDIDVLNPEAFERYFLEEKMSLFITIMNNGFDMNNPDLEELDKLLKGEYQNFVASNATDDQITINIKDKRTRTIFKPNGFAWLSNSAPSSNSLPENISIEMDSLGDIRTTQTLPRNSEYTVSIFDLPIIVLDDAAYSSSDIYDKSFISDLTRFTTRMSSTSDGRLMSALASDIYRRDSIMSLNRIYDGVDYGLDYEHDNSDSRSMQALLDAYLYAYSGSSSMQATLDVYGLASSDVKVPESVVLQANLAVYSDFVDLVSEKYLKAYRDYAYETFMDLPENLPERVSVLAHDLTINEAANYDKLNAIKAYLSTYEYTLTPGAFDPETDFVDDFLFVKGKGYCTSFASAMTVMARAIGLPARYVEGYAMPEEQSSEGVYLITKNKAHAWCEVYLAGVGWMIFEPISRTSLNELPAEETQYPPSYDVPDYNSEEFRQRYGAQYVYEEDYGEPFDENYNNQSVNKASQEGRWNLTSIILWAILAIALLAVIFILAKILIVRRKMKRINQLPINERAIEYFKCILKYNSQYGYPIQNSETVYRYAKRIGQRFAYVNQTVSFEQIAGIFSRAYYSRNKITQEELDLIIIVYKEMEIEYRSTRTRKTYFYYKYISEEI